MYTKVTNSELGFLCFEIRALLPQLGVLLPGLGKLRVQSLKPVGGGDMNAREES
jgi:hypothetical protein